MLDFDFDVVTGPSKASHPAPTDAPAPEEEEHATAAPISAPIGRARSGGS